jgi:NTE family protein
MKEVGLALGGGAILGAAHVGALQAIDEFDIKVTHVAGTSIGAVAAAFVAFGKSWKEIHDIFCDLNWMDVSAISLSKFALLSNEKLGDLIIDHIGDKNLEDANIPISMVATDITKGKRVVLNSGPVALAVMASTCIPGIFKPVEVEGQMLVDGGVVENVPIQTLRDMGPDFVIGIDLNAEHRYGKPQNIIDVIMNSFHFLMQQSDKLQTQNADLLIKPDLSGFNRADVDQYDDLVEKGYTYARKTLEEVDWNGKESSFSSWFKMGRR